jgi:hypothetical protein
MSITLAQPTLCEPVHIVAEGLHEERRVTISLLAKRQVERQ